MNKLSYSGSQQINNTSEKQHNIYKRNKNSEQGAKKNFDVDFSNIEAQERTIEFIEDTIKTTSYME